MSKRGANKFVRLWVETGAGKFAYRVNGVRADGSIKLGMVRANTEMGINSELAGLARRHKLLFTSSPRGDYEAVSVARLRVAAGVTPMGFQVFRVIAEPTNECRGVTLQVFNTRDGAVDYLVNRAIDFDMHVTRGPGEFIVATEG